MWEVRTIERVVASGLPAKAATKGNRYKDLPNDAKDVDVPVVILLKAFAFGFEPRHETLNIFELVNEN